MFTANLKMMILDTIFSITIKASNGVSALTFWGEHSSFVPFNGEMVICCILMYTLKTGIPMFVQTAIGTLQKVDHVATKPLNPYPFASAINGTNNVFFISVIYSVINKFIIYILFYFFLHVTGTHF